MSDRLEAFSECCDEIGCLIDRIPRAADRDRARARIEELVEKMANGEWLGCRVVWVDPVPDTPEWLEGLG